MTNAGHMFDAAHAFNSDVSRQDASRLQNAKNMFTGASTFNQNMYALEGGQQTVLIQHFRIFLDLVVQAHWITILQPSCEDPFAMGVNCRARRHHHAAKHRIAVARIDNQRKKGSTAVDQPNILLSSSIGITRHSCLVIVASAAFRVMQLTVHVEICS